jgi:hypothetical protein
MLDGHNLHHVETASGAERFEHRARAGGQQRVAQRGAEIQRLPLQERYAAR